MRQLSINILLILVCLLTTNPSWSAISGGVHYSIPVDYSKISEQDLLNDARKNFYNALKAQDKTITEDITKALLQYTALSNINPDCIEYPIKLGILYDKLEKDRYAKGNFSRAIGLDASDPEPYFYLGEFYYKRESYRKALKYYNEAYKRGFSINYDMLFRMGDIYQKFGDTRSALKYLNEALRKNPNVELENKIKKIEAEHAINKEFYSTTRIRG